MREKKEERTDGKIENEQKKDRYKPNNINNHIKYKRSKISNKRQILSNQFF